MATIRYDTELMQSAIAAQPVSASGGARFQTIICSGSGRAGAIVLTNDSVPKFNIVYVNDTGALVTGNLAAALAIPQQSTVMSFHLVQNEDLLIYLAVAVKNSNGIWQLNVLLPFTTDTFVKGQIQRFPLLTTDPILELQMSAAPTDVTFPLVIARTSANNGGRFLRFAAQVQSKTLVALPDYNPPDFGGQVLGFCGAEDTVLGKGIWVLYSTKGPDGPNLGNEYAKLDQNDSKTWTYSTRRAWCPPNATSIASFFDGPHRSGILVSYRDGLNYYNSRSLERNEFGSALVANNSPVMQARALQVAQNSETLVIWTRMLTGDIGHLETTVPIIKAQQGEGTVPLLRAERFYTEASSVGFSPALIRPSPIVHTASELQYLVTVDQSGIFSQYTGDRNSGSWTSTLFADFSIESFSFVDSYSIRLAVTDASGSPVANGKININSSVSSLAVVNGMPMSLTTAGTWCNLDNNGILSVILPTKSVASADFSITSVKDVKGNIIQMNPASGVVLNASAKVLKAFSGVTDNTDLTTLTSQNGNKLWSSSNPPPDRKIRDECTKALAQLSSLTASQIANATVQQPGKPFRNDTQNKSLVSSFLSAGPTILHGIESGANEAGSALQHGFETVAQSVEGLVVEVVNGVHKLTIKLANEVKEFILDTLFVAGQAFDFIWSRLKLGLQEIKEFAGFLFNWGDVQRVSGYMQSALDGGLDDLKNQVEVLKKTIDGFLTDAESKITARLSNHTESDRGINQAQDAQDSTSRFGSLTHSPAVHFLFERFSNGGGMTNSAISTDVPSGQSSKVPNFKSTMQPGSSDMKNAVDKITHDLQDLFKKTGALKASDVWSKIASGTISGVFKALRSVINGVLTALYDLIALFESLGNRPIKIPVLSTLLKLQGFGDITAFGFVCTLIAYPAVVLFKLATGKQLPLPSIPPQHLISTLIVGNANIREAEKRDFNIFMSVISAVATLGVGLWTTYQIGKAIIDQGPAGGIEPVRTGAGVGPVNLTISTIKLMVAASGLSIDPNQPGFKPQRAAAVMSTFSAIVSGVYMFTGTSEPPQVQMMEEFYMGIALLKFALFDAACAEEVVATARQSDSDLRNTYAILAAQTVSQNLTNTLGSVGRYIAMMTAMIVDETLEAGPEVELLEIAAVAGFAVYGASLDALVVSKVIAVFTTYETNAKGVVIVPASL